MAGQKLLTKPVSRSLRLQFGQFYWIHDGRWRWPAEGRGDGVYDEKLQTRFAPKYVYTNDPILSNMAIR